MYVLELEVEQFFEFLLHLLNLQVFLLNGFPALNFQSLATLS